MTTPRWPAEFSDQVRAEIIARDTPPGLGWPRCVVCGLKAGRIIHIHHCRYKSRGGDGRPSNGIVVCGDGQGESCHRKAIHEPTVAAWRCAGCGWPAGRWRGQCPRCQAWGTIDGDAPSVTARGWAISRHAPLPRAYRRPVLCAWRGWIILGDRPWAENGLLWRPATDRDMRGDYCDEAAAR